MANTRRKISSKNMISKMASRFHHITVWASILLPNEVLTQNCIQSTLSPVIGTLNCRSLNFMIPQCLIGVRHQSPINPSLQLLQHPGCLERKKKEKEKNLMLSFTPFHLQFNGGIPSAACFTYIFSSLIV